MRFSTKISLAISTILITTLIFIGVFVGSSTRELLYKETSEAKFDQSKDIINLIDRILYERYVDIQVVAEDDLIESLLNRKLQQSNPDVINQIEELTRLTGPWEELHIYNLAGEDISPLKKESGLSTVEQYERSMLDEAVEGKVTYSDVLIDDSGDQTILFSAPVRDEDKEDDPVIGVVMGHLSTQIVKEALFEVSAPSIAYLYKKDGSLVATSESDYSERATSVISYKKNSTLARAIKDEEKYFIGQSSSHDVLGDKNDEVHDGHSDTLVSIAFEEGHLGYLGNDWVLTIETNSRIAYAPSRLFVNKIFAVVSFIFIAGTLILIFFIRKIWVRPMETVFRTVDKIALGDLGARVSRISGDEIGRLGLTINRMAENIANMIGEIAVSKSNDDAILGSIGDALVSVNKDGIIIIFNDAAVKLTGFKSTEALGQHYRGILKFNEEGSEKPYRDFIGMAIKTGLPVWIRESSILLTRKDGSTVYVADSAAPVKTDKGEVIGCVVVLRDVTREREIDRAKTEFISIASHQLRTPLGGMRWNLETLQMETESLPEKAKDRIKGILDADLRTLQLVNDLLNVSRIEQGRVKNEPENTDLVEIIRRAVTEITPEATKRSVGVELSILKEMIPSTFIDAKHFREVVQNLVTNAVKYTRPNGHVSLKVDFDTNFITLAVSDNGIGIPEADKSKIFGKFVRASNAQVSNTDGTGLGLYVAKSFVEGWGGKVWFDSKEGGGSTFYITVPIVLK